MTKPAATPPEAPVATASPGHRAGGVATADASTGMKNKKTKIAALVALLVILLLLFVWYLMNRKPLSELPGLSDTKLPHYEMSIYGTSKPLGVAVTPSGDRIYVTQSDGARVTLAFDKAGKRTAILKPPSSTGGNHLPMYVAINPKTQDVYVSDRLSNSIYIYNAKGTYLRKFAPKGDFSGTWAPLGLAFAPDGTLYVTDLSGKDASAHRVDVFGADGTFVRSMGKPGQLNYPNGIVVDPAGNIEVSDSNNGRLVVFSPLGKIVAAISQGIGEGDLGLPRGAAADDSGRLFVVDTVDHQVRVYLLGDATSLMPKYVGSFGDEGQLDGTFEYPNGVATDTRAHVYVTDRENNRVQVWGF